MSIILGILVLLIAPITFHLVSSRSKKFQDILASLIIGNFILISCIIILSIFQIFNGYYALTLSIVTAGIIGRLTKFKLKSKDITVESVIIAIFFGTFIRFLQNSTLQTITGDAFARYLPWARIITKEHFIPAVYNDNLTYHLIGYPPFLQGIGATLFSVINMSDPVIASIPIMFSSLTILILINWAQEFKNKLAYIFVILSLLVSYRYIMLSHMMLTEPIVLFFATSGFYFLFKYVKERKTSLLVLLSLSFSLVNLTKYSGLLLSLVVFLCLIIKAKSKKEMLSILVISLLTNIIMVYWLLRNYYFFNNPFFPLLTKFFSGKWNDFVQMFPAPPESRQVGLSNLPKEFFVKFPATIFALFFMFKKRKTFPVKFIFTAITLSILFIAYHQQKIWIRYQMQFFGIIALFSGLFLAQLYASKIFNFLKNKRELFLQVITILFVLLIILIVQFDLSPRTFPRQQFNNQFDVLEYLQEKEQNKLTILSQGSLVLDWYGNHEIITPRNNFYLIIENKEIIEYDKDADYYYNIFKKYGIKYIYDSTIETKYTPINEEDPYYYKYINSNLTNYVFSVIEKDNRFNLVFQKEKERLWEVK